MRISSRGQVTIPVELRRKHGLLPLNEIEFVDYEHGVLIVKVEKKFCGQHVLASLLRGGKVKGNTASWLRLTRGA